MGAQDTNQSSEDWHPGYQDSNNELSIYFTQCSSPDIKPISGEEQGQSKLEPVLLSKI
jgi:hypothetical protein